MRTRRRALAAVIAAVIIVTGCSSAEDDAEPATTDAATDVGLPRPGRTLADIPDLVAQVSPSVVAIRTVGGQGSGVVWESSGRVVTNAHVVAGTPTADVVLADGTVLDAEVEATDPLTDLAVLTVDGEGLPVLPRSGEAPPVGTPVVAVGNPLGFENTVSMGIISGERRSFPRAAQFSPALVDLLQTDAAISPGNSGGALVDFDGNLVGVTVAYLSPREVGAVSIGFAIPVTTVSEVVTQLIETGEVVHAFAGFELQPVTRQLADAFDLPEGGAIIVGILDDGPAARAGLRTGDVVVAVDGERIDSVEDVLGAVRRRRPGDALDLVVVRSDDGSGELRFTIVLSTRPGE